MYDPNDPLPEPGEGYGPLPEPDDALHEVGLSRYRKTITALAGAAVIVATTYLGLEHASTIAAVLTVLGVYTVPNAD
jgi:hypothetical protein